MRLRTFTVSLIAAVAATLPLAGVALAQIDDRDCADFASQADAQAALDASIGDPERLDANNDGTACESYDYSTATTPSTSDTTTPTTSATTSPTSPTSPTSTTTTTTSSTTATPTTSATATPTTSAAAPRRPSRPPATTKRPTAARWPSSRAVASPPVTAPPTTGPRDRS